MSVKDDGETWRRETRKRLRRRAGKLSVYHEIGLQKCLMPKLEEGESQKLMDNEKVENQARMCSSSKLVPLLPRRSIDSAAHWRDERRVGLVSANMCGFDFNSLDG